MKWNDTHKQQRRTQDRPQCVKWNYNSYMLPLFGMYCYLLIKDCVLKFWLGILRIWKLRIVLILLIFCNYLNILMNNYTLYRQLRKPRCLDTGEQLHIRKSRMKSKSPWKIYLKLRISMTFQRRLKVLF
jgi:hypothetical protein